MTSLIFHRICFIRRLLPLGKIITRDIMASNEMADGRRNAGNFCSILCALVGLFRLSVSLWGCANASSAEGGGGGRNQTENGNRKGALAASGRGAIEEGRMPVSTNRANFKRHQRSGSDPDHDNANCHDDERHDRVHHDAELAMIGIGGD